MVKKLGVLLRSKESGQSIQTLWQAFDGKMPGVELLGFDTERPSSASAITITYEGDGVFTIRPNEGSKIAILGSRHNDPHLFEDLNGVSTPSRIAPYSNPKGSK
jgi:hypothetical protein